MGVVESSDGERQELLHFKRQVLSRLSISNRSVFEHRSRENWGGRDVDAEEISLREESFPSELSVSSSVS